MQEISDREYVLRTRRGDADAYGELVRRYQTSVFGVCYRLLAERKEAEDQTQEAFIRAYDRFATYDVGRPFGPWIRRVAANVCLNFLRRVRPPELALDEERDPAAGLSPDALGEEREAAQDLRAAIAALPPHYRIMIELRHYQGLSYEEIARDQRLPLSDVKSRLFRARKHLAQRLRSDV